MTGRRVPRRIVLLTAGESSEPEATLAGQRHPAVSGRALHADLRACAEAHRGRLVAGEWFDGRVWVRFLWAGM